MDCRPSCGACCVAPSINSAIPGMPHGKPAGVPCIQLLADFKCALFGKPERPAFCGSLQPSVEMCGAENLENPREYAINWLSNLEAATKPA
jgi:uncharacterized protein